MAAAPHAAAACAGARAAPWACSAARAAGAAGAAAVPCSSSRLVGFRSDVSAASRGLRRVGQRAGAMRARAAPTGVVAEATTEGEERQLEEVRRPTPRATRSTNDATSCCRRPSHPCQT